MQPVEALQDERTAAPRFRENFLGAFVVAVLAVGIRLSHLSDTAMWDDEAFRYDLARGERAHVSASHAPWVEIFQHDPATAVKVGSVADSLRMLRGDSPYPPGYYLVLHALQKVGVTSPRHLGVVNALSGGVVAACLFLLGRRRLSGAGAAAAAVLYAMSGWDLGVSMQLKETAMATALGFASTACFVWALDRGLSWWRWLISGALLGGAVLTQQQSVYFGVIQVLLLAVSLKPGRELVRRAVGGWAFGAALVLPWIAWAGPAQLGHLRVVNQQFGGDWAGFAGLPERLKMYLGFSIAPLGPEFLREGWATALVGTAGLASIIAFVIARRRARPVGPALETAALGAFIWLGGLFCAVVTYVLMRQNQALWARYSPLFLPGAWLVVAALLDKAGSKVGGGGVPVVLAGLLAVLLLPRPLDPLPLDRYGDWTAATRALQGHAVDGDLIVHLPGANAMDAFLHAWPLKTRHVVSGEFSDELVDSLQSQANGRPVWMVFAWGQSALLPKFDEAFSRDGWQRTNLPSNADLPPLFDRLPVGPRMFPDAFVVVGFSPPAP